MNLKKKEEFMMKLVWMVQTQPLKKNMMKALNKDKDKELDQQLCYHLRMTIRTASMMLMDVLQIKNKLMDGQFMMY